MVNYAEFLILGHSYWNATHRMLPIFPGPAPSLGDEIGALDAEVEAQVEQIFNENSIPSIAMAVVAGELAT